MIRWNRRRACAFVAATACAAATAVAFTGPTAGADDGLVQTAEWNPFPKDTVGHAFLAVDDVARVGYAFSGTVEQSWSRVQAVNLDTGKPVSAVVPTREMPSRTPVIVDSKRKVLLYAETYPTSGARTVANHIVGIGLRGKEVKELFRVPSPLGPLRIAGMAYDDAAEDLIVLGTADGAGQGALQGASVTRFQRVPVAALLANAATARWTEPVQLPPNACPTPLQTSQPAAVLVERDTVWIACRGTSNGATGTIGQNLTPASGAILRIDGVTRAAKPSVAVRQFRTAGNFTLAGESVADDRTRRFSVVESSGYVGLRVFDTDHSRWVGRINAGAQAMYGVTSDPKTSRAYFISMDAKVGIGFGDIEAIVPTQGERLPSPYSGLIGYGVQRRLSFDSGARRLFVPMRRQNEQGGKHEYLIVLKDTTDPYRAPEGVDHARGSLDVVDRVGVTESAIASTARAYGVDYQLIGGTANLLQNLTGTDNRGTARPGSRHVRAAYVKSGSLTGDGAIAYATTAEEDATTDQDRHQVTAPSPAPSSATAGSRFAPVAECSDYGAGKTTSSVPGANVACDLKADTVHAAATFQGDDAVLITAPPSSQQAPVRAPVQVGRAFTEVREQRGANRGALVTTITTTAENVTIGGVVTIGRVTQVVTLTTHGRTGTARVERKPSIGDVVVNGSNLCGARCDMAMVQREVNKALDGRGGIDFPQASVVVAKRGTYAEITQDPWYHAERVFDYDKADDDYVVPVMSVQMWLDSTSKSRLVVDLAGVAGTASYRIYPMGDEYDGGGDGDGGSDEGGSDGGVVVEVPRPGVSIAPSAAPVPAGSKAPVAPQVAAEDPGFFGGLVDRLSLSFRSFTDAVPLLLIWALLGVPCYLAARRRLLLELPMLTRDEELT